MRHTPQSTLIVYATSTVYTATLAIIGQLIYHERHIDITPAGTFAFLIIALIVTYKATTAKHACILASIIGFGISTGGLIAATTISTNESPTALHVLTVLVAGPIIALIATSPAILARKLTTRAPAHNQSLE